MNLAPSADVAVEGSPAADVSFSSDPATVARFVRAAVGGYERVKMVSAVGHFPGQGSVSQDPSEGPATVGASLADLRGRDLLPFAAVIRRAPVITMSDAAYAAWDGVTPAALLPDAVKLLRGMGFQGVVMADELGDAAGAAGEPIGQAAVDALKAGDDLMLVSGPASDQDAAVGAVIDAVHRGDVRRARIRESLLRLLELMAPRRAE